MDERNTVPFCFTYTPVAEIIFLTLYRLQCHSGHFILANAERGNAALRTRVVRYHCGRY